MKNKTGIWLVGFLCVAFFLAMVVMPVKGQAGDVIKIGVLAPYHSPSGAGIKNAAEMARDEINAAGGILGKKIELVISNTKYNPKIGADSYKRFVLKDKVVVVTGTSSSGTVAAVVEQMARYKVPYIPTCGSIDRILLPKMKKNYNKYKYLFNGGHLSSEIAGVTTDWIINDLSLKLNIKRAALMIESAIWTRPIAEIWSNNLKAAGIEISAFEYFDVDTKDFTPILTKILKSKAEVLLMLISHVDAATFINQWHDMKGPIMAGVTASTSVIWGASKGKVLTVVELGGSIPGGLTPKSLPFQDAYKKRFKKDLPYTAAYQYDVMYMIKAAFEKTKSTDPDAFVKAMEEMDHVGAAGRWLFDKKTHHSKFGPGYRQFFMSQWQLPQGKTEGELCIIWPSNLKQCDWIMPSWYKK